MFAQGCTCGSEQGSRYFNSYTAYKKQIKPRFLEPRFFNSNEDGTRSNTVLLPLDFKSFKQTVTTFKTSEINRIKNGIIMCKSIMRVHIRNFIPYMTYSCQVIYYILKQNVCQGITRASFWIISHNFS